MPAHISPLIPPYDSQSPKTQLAFPDTANSHSYHFPSAAERSSADF